MTALDRTAYPRFRRKPLTGEVAATFTLSDDEIRLLHNKIKRSSEHRLAVTATTNKTESYNGFSKLLAFGGEVIAQNDLIEQEKVIKYGHLLANAVILWNAVHQTRIIRKLRQNGMKITKEQVAYLSPYTLAHIKRFGDYWLEFDSIPEPIDGELPLDN